MSTQEQREDDLIYVKKAMIRMTPERRAVVEQFIDDLMNDLKSCQDHRTFEAGGAESLRASLRAHQYRIDYLMRRVALYDALFAGAIYKLLMKTDDKESPEQYVERCWQRIEEFNKSPFAKNNP